MARAKYRGARRNSDAEAERDRRALYLLETLGLEPEQIAARLCMGRSSVRERIARARADRDAEQRT